MRHFFQSLILVTATFIVALPVHAQSNGPLRVHSENPRYFTDDSGVAILLAGSHTWNNIVDMGPADPPPAFDFDAYLDWLESYGHNFTRGWTWEPTKWDTTRMKNPTWRNESHTIAPHPWPRTGPGEALDGGPKFDLEQINPAYLERLTSRVAEAQARGIFISVMLFEGFAVQFLQEAWPNHPFNAANNINGIDADANGDGKGIEVHQLANKRVTRVQENYVRTVVQALNDFDNVLYEISNETHPSSTEWQYHMIRFIKACESELPKQHPVGMTYQNRRGSNETLYNSPADWISPNSEGGYRDDPPDMDGRKVIVIDTDHLWGIGGDATWVWKCVTRGLNPIFMDPYLGKVLASTAPKFDPARRAMGEAINYTRRMNLAKATPRNGLASTGYCLAEPGEAYLIFAPDSGTISLDLSDADGTFGLEWLKTKNGKRERGDTIEGSAVRSLESPFKGPAVVFLKRIANSPPTPG